MDATLPTYFWGILSILLIAVTFNRAWVLPFKKWRLEADKRRLEADKMWRDKIESAYSYISKVHKPKILNQAKLGNQDFMKEVAQNEIDLIRPLLVRKYGENNVPRKIDINDATSITVWYEFFRDERVKHLE